MSHIYAMQRANGDWFAFDAKGRFGVPLFHSRRDAMIARSRNLGMLLFKPVALNSAILKELIPIGGESDVDFWLVNDPLVNLNRGHLVEYAQLVRLMQTPIELQLSEGQADDRTPMNGSVAESDASASAHRAFARRSHQIMFKKWSQARHY